MKADLSTYALNKHIKIHKIDITSVEDSVEETPAKKAKIQNYFGPKEPPYAITELLAKMTSVDGISFGAICKSESLQYIFKKAGYALPKTNSGVKDKVMEHFKSIKMKIMSEISEAKNAGIRLSVTCDESTSVRNRRFMNLNAHFERNCMSLGMARVNGSLPGI